MTDLLVKHHKIVKSHKVMEYEHVGSSSRFKAEIRFKDDSSLSIRQIVIESFFFKYAYHWQDREGQLIRRWDNAPHWPAISTFPHHKHVRSQTDQLRVLESRGGDLEIVFQEIAEWFEEK